MASVTIIRNKTLPDSSQKQDFYDLVELLQIVISQIVNADISSSAAIADSKLAQITTAGKVLFSALQVASEAQGDIMYRNSSAWVRLGAGTDGQFLETNGAGANPSWSTVTTINYPSFQNAQLFTGSGTWTRPAGVDYVFCKVWGGGGGGGGGGSSSSLNSGGGIGGGGGGSGYSEGQIAVTGNVTVTVGAAGSAGTAGTGGGAGGNGGNGGTSSFAGGTTIQATGGSGGTGGGGTSATPTHGAGGAGGAGSVGALNLTGKAGSLAVALLVSAPAVLAFREAKGGSCPLGGLGGDGGNYVDTLPGVAGASGTTYGGGGGGGGGACDNNDGSVGGAGAAGAVLVYW